MQQVHSALREDWRGGFLFLGNLLALDFLNTRPVIQGETVELLPDGAALARWCGAAELIGRSEAGRLARRWSSPQFAPDLAALRKFRENLRAAAFRIEAGRSVSIGFVKTLNRLLLRYPYVNQLAMGASGPLCRKRFAPARPRDVFAPVAHAAAGLLARAHPQRIRKCRQCVLHFYDTSKKGTRQWCSMNMCGNRAKAAAFASRRRAAAAAS